MRLEIELKTNIDDIVIDYIEARLKSGKTVSLNWDSTDYTRADGTYNACYRGVYFDEQYANGHIRDLEGMEIVAVGIYSEHEALDPITFTEMVFSEGMECYEPKHLLPFTVPDTLIDRT